MEIIIHGTKKHRVGGTCIMDTLEMVYISLEQKEVTIYTWSQGGDGKLAFDHQAHTLTPTPFLASGLDIKLFRAPA